MKLRALGLSAALIFLLSCFDAPSVLGAVERKDTCEFAKHDLWLSGHEIPYGRPAPKLKLGKRRTTPALDWVRGAYVSVQVNVDAQGNNIVGDAANEPSIAVDPTNPSRIVIGWRQFDTILDNFRQAGQGYSHDAGLTWTFLGVLEPGEFSSDPVVDVDADGNFYYYALQTEREPSPWPCYMYKSYDGGQTWPQEVYARGGDKAWFTIDRTGGVGHGHVYVAWSPSAGCCGADIFTRSKNGGLFFSDPIPIPENPRWGTLTVAPDGALFIAGAIGGADELLVVRSTNARDPAATPQFDQVASVDLTGGLVMSAGPNPGGLLGQVWVASDHSDGPTRGNLYLLASVDPPGEDPLDIMFSRSTDGGLTWSEAVRVNDDSDLLPWQWFGTMSVAPNGRIDAIWNDTRNDRFGYDSELYYSYSMDAGVTWSVNVPLSPSFDPHLGWPLQNKLGDYYDMVSDNFGVSIAYAATFNGEQNVYYLRIGDLDCNHNDVPDADDVASGTSDDCNDNNVPDECEPDCNENGTVDVCDVWNGFSDDCDDNLNPDECDPDFDGDGAIDGCDLDADGDGVFNHNDACPFTPLGLPVDGSGRPLCGNSGTACVIDLDDYDHLASDCLNVGGPDAVLGGRCPNYDLDGDGDVDLVDASIFMWAFGH